MEIKIDKPQSILIIPIGRLNRKMQENVKGHKSLIYKPKVCSDTTNVFKSFEQEFSAQTN